MQKQGFLEFVYVIMFRCFIATHRTFQQIQNGGFSEKWFGAGQHI